MEKGKVESTEGGASDSAFVPTVYLQNPWFIGSDPKLLFVCSGQDYEAPEALRSDYCPQNAEAMEGIHKL